MKYNDDINPMKKEIGLLIEEVLLFRFVDEEHTQCIVDSNGDVYTCLPGELTAWEGNEEWGMENNRFPDFAFVPVLFTIEHFHYIKHNWKDLIFSLGAKDE